MLWCALLSCFSSYYIFIKLSTPRRTRIEIITHIYHWEGAYMVLMLILIYPSKVNKIRPRKHPLLIQEALAYSGTHLSSDAFGGNQSRWLDIPGVQFALGHSIKFPWSLRLFINLYNSVSSPISHLVIDFVGDLGTTLLTYHEILGR